MTQKKADLPQGTLDLLILRALSTQPMHGYAIGQRIAQVSRAVLQVQQGSLYPALHRLEERALVGAEWKETEGGRMAKYYSLTRKGRRQLKTEEDNWARLSDAITLVLKEA